MADNVTFGSGNNATPPSSTVISTEDVTTLNGATVTAQHVQRAGVTLITANGTAVDAPGDSANGIDVDVTRSALPTGAATSANQTSELAKLDSLIAAIATESTLTAMRTLLGAGLPSALASDRLKVDGSGVTQPVSAAALPLPTGAATAANQTTANSSLASIDGKLAAASAAGDGLAKPTTAPALAWLIGYNGATGDLVRAQSFRVDLNAVSITSIATVWTPTAGKKFRLMGGSISVSAACNVLFEDNSAGAGNFVWRTPKLAADTPYNFDLGNGKLSAAINQVLKATASAAATITGTLYGVEE